MKKRMAAMEELLSALRSYALAHNVPVMEDDALAFLTDYFAANGIKSLLEVGTAIGYSAIALANATADLQILSLEIDPERYEMARQNVERAGLSKRISLVNCDARKYECCQQFDAILLDGPKAHNRELLQRFEGCLKKDGHLIIDDVRFHGFIDNPEVIRTRRLKTLVRKFSEFLNWLKNSEEYECTELPIGDGLLIARKKEN